MAYEIPGFSFTLPAGIDLSSSEFTLVDIDANGFANVPTASGARVVGALNNKPKLGEAATIVRAGIAQVTAGAAIAVGANVQTNAVGQAITLTGSNYKAGVALEAASAAGIIIAVLMTVG